MKKKILAHSINSGRSEKGTKMLTENKKIKQEGHAERSRSIAKNKKAFFDYEILETFEAGIVLSGSEVKSVKASHVQLMGSYVSIRGAEIWLIGAHISPYKQGQTFEPMRERKLLLKKEEIKHLIGKLNTAGITLVPTEIYLKKNLIKVAVSIARGKKQYDKREIKKKRELERSLRREYKNIKI